MLKCEGELFDKYACIYCSMLDLYEHNTKKIRSLLNQDNFLNQNRYSFKVFKQKIKSVSSEKDIFTNKLNKDNGNVNGIEEWRPNINANSNIINTKI